MTQDFKEHIKHLAEMTLDLCKRDGPPVPVDEIANRVGLKVYPFNFPDEISGVLKKEKKAIGVNINHSVFRRRFTVAHEIGHFILGHEGLSNDSFVDEKFDLPQNNEREANLFASYLLMPEAWIKKSFNTVGADTKRLSNIFLVSDQAMTIRLLELGLLKEGGEIIT